MSHQAISHALTKKLLRATLLHPIFISLGKAVLRPFPYLQESIAALVYPLKEKKHISCMDSTIRTLPEAKSIGLPLNYQPQLLFDVSEIAIRDIRSGIPRVVRNLLWNIIQNPPSEYRFAAVRTDSNSQLVYARHFTSSFLGLKDNEETDSPVIVAPGDIFFCADLHLQFPFHALQKLRLEGLRTIFTVYDLIPLRDNIFPKTARLSFADWFHGVLATADGLVCDSRSVADELYEWLESHPNIRSLPLPIGYFHLGADFTTSPSAYGSGFFDPLFPRYDQTIPTLLMVGTVEAPRKGYDQVLDALELLWAEGQRINLIIIGREGWLSHRLIRRIRHHRQIDKQLFWLGQTSDSLLNQLYNRSTALLAASIAEGFGLPLIEAAHHGIPIIARDIPVFREVAGKHAYYFPNTNPKGLAEAIRHWLTLHHTGSAPTSVGMPYLSWEQSTRQLLDVILHENWYLRWSPIQMQKELTKDILNEN